MAEAAEAADTGHVEVMAESIHSIALNRRIQLAVEGGGYGGAGGSVGSPGYGYGAGGCWHSASNSMSAGGGGGGYGTTMLVTASFDKAQGAPGICIIRWVTREVILK